MLKGFYMSIERLAKENSVDLDDLGIVELKRQQPSLLPDDVDEVDLFGEIPQILSSDGNGNGNTLFYDGDNEFDEELQYLLSEDIEGD